MDIIRATENWQRAGAYYVRVQAMARKHHITLSQEFDEHDTPETKYIVILDNDFPIATARMYQLNSESAMIGRVVVLPEYRHQGIGSKVIRECEQWVQKITIATFKSWLSLNFTLWNIENAAIPIQKTIAAHAWVHLTF